MEMDFAYPNPSSFRQPFDSPRNAYGSGSSSYPKVAHPVGPLFGHPAPLVPSNPPSRIGIKVALKPKYQMAPPPQLLPEVDNVPPSSFQFDFDLERRILEEAEHKVHSLNGTEPPRSSKNAEATAPGSVEDLIVSKYCRMGLNKEAVVFAIATFGDVQAKVMDFVASYNLLREMGFSPDSVAGALAMYDNDKERALAHLVA